MPGQRRPRILLRTAIQFTLVALLLAAVVPHVHAAAPSPVVHAAVATQADGYLPCPACLYRLISLSVLPQVDHLAKELDQRRAPCSSPRVARAMQAGSPRLTRGPPATL